MSVAFSDDSDYPILILSSVQRASFYRLYLASFYGSLLGNERENTFAKCLYSVSVFCLQFKTFVERMRMTSEVGITKAREEGH